MAGDSQASLVVLSLLSFVLDNERMDSIRGDLYRRHSDNNIVVDEIGLKLDFYWATYEKSLTNMVSKFRAKRKYPDVLISNAMYLRKAIICI